MYNSKRRLSCLSILETIVVVIALSILTLGD